MTEKNGRKTRKICVAVQSVWRKRDKEMEHGQSKQIIRKKK
jgi:hypothetical protein